MDNNGVERALREKTAEHGADPISSIERSGLNFATALNTPSPDTQDFCLSVAIPVYNEAATVLELLRQVRAVDVPMEIILVEDGSTDGTADLLRREVEDQYPDVHVVYHPKNRGKGAAIVTAIGHATGDFLIVQDADLEYDPQEYRTLLPALVDGTADVVYGSRFLGSIANMRWSNRLANRILTIAANILFPGSRITDEATCYKMFRLSLLKTLPLRARRFDFCPEVTAKVLKRGVKIVEVPINYKARTAEQGKKIVWTDGVEALMTLIKYRFVD